jgi:hypothetical protein
MSDVSHTPGTPRGEDQGGESNEEGRKGADRPYGQVEDDPMDSDNA